MKTFEQAYREIAPYTIVTEARCRMLWHIARYAAGLPGDMAELGVYRGGTAMLIKAAADSRFPGKINTVYAFDTFGAGIPNANAEVDGHKSGDFSITESEAGLTLERLKIKEICPVPATMQWVAQAEAFRLNAYCFAHFDGDTYQSAKEFLQYFWPRMVTGGFMVFDDYDWHMCKGVKKALDEHFETTGAFALLSGEEYQAVLVKAI